MPLGPATTIVATLCPGGKERMRRLMALLDSGRLDLGPMITHRFPLDRIDEAYDLFAHQRDGVLKVAIAPQSPVVGGRAGHGQRRGVGGRGRSTAVYASKEMR